MSNMTETQSKGIAMIDAFLDREKAQKMIINGVRELMHQAQTRYEAGKEDWGACVDVKMSTDMAETLKEWAWPSLAALGDCMRERAPSHTITVGVYATVGALRLSLYAYREQDHGLFDNMEELIEECFEE